MEVSIGVSKRDQGVELIAERLDAPLRSLSERLSRDYGSEIEHLWIDIEMSPIHADELPEPWPFRFQKKVVPPEGISTPPKFNVAHFGVRPDFSGVALDRVLEHVLEALYEASEVLTRKASKFPRFRAHDFRADLAREIASIIR